MRKDDQNDDEKLRFFSFFFSCVSRAPGSEASHRDSIRKLCGTSYALKT
jgi:hypothetical protein